jgi:hypothetical protein
MREQAASQRVSSRRRVLGLGAASLGAIAATVVGRGEAVAAASPVVGTSDTAQPAVDGYNSDAGPGVRGTSAEASGVEGLANSNGYPGVFGTNADTGFNAAGVRGTVVPGGHGMGVDGQAVNGVGVSGTSQEYVGVSAGSLNGIAFQAFAPGAQAALRVFGHARFSTLGSGTIPAGADATFVPFLSVTAQSHIMVALTSDPGSKATVQWIARAAGTGFTLHLTATAKIATTFTFFIVQPTFEPGVTI